MRKLRYWYEAIPPILKRTDLVPAHGAFEVRKHDQVVAVVSAAEAERLTSWTMKAVVWEEKHGA